MLAGFSNYLFFQSTANMTLGKKCRCLFVFVKSVKLTVPSFVQFVKYRNEEQASQLVISQSVNVTNTIFCNSFFHLQNGYWILVPPYQESPNRFWNMALWGCGFLILLLIVFVDSFLENLYIKNIIDINLLGL